MTTVCTASTECGHEKRSVVTAAGILSTSGLAVLFRLRRPAFSRGAARRVDNARVADDQVVRWPRGDGDMLDCLFGGRFHRVEFSGELLQPIDTGARVVRHVGGVCASVPFLSLAITGWANRFVYQQAEVGDVRPRWRAYAGNLAQCSRRDQPRFELFQILSTVFSKAEWNDCVRADRDWSCRGHHHDRHSGVVLEQ